MFLSWQPAAVGIRMSALQLQLQIPQAAGAAQRSQHQHPYNLRGQGTAWVLGTWVQQAGGTIRKFRVCIIAVLFASREK